MYRQSARENPAIGSSCSALLVCAIVVMCAPLPSCAFYVPGIAPVEFRTGDLVEVKAVKMTSIKTQLPFEYFSLPFCQPKTGIVYKTENLGEILRGDRIVNTAYDVRMNQATGCRELCAPITLTKNQVMLFEQRIKEVYSVHLLVDNLPAATKFRLVGANHKDEQYEHGFRLGFMRKQQTYLNNHLIITIKYHTDDGVMHRVVGFEVEPRSVAFSTKSVCQTGLKPDTPPQLVSLENSMQKLRFTYEVKWVKSSVRWASRWDTYLAMSDVQIHWFSIINSVVIIFFLSAILTMIMIRTLRKDIAKYNRDEELLLEETLEETGWKLVHGDVFRPPRRAPLLAALVGSGLQTFGMLFLTILLAMLGMLSPASRGALMSAGVFLYVLMGLVAGYFAARLYRTMRGQQWKRAALLTALLFPALVLGSGFLLNLFIWGSGSSGALPFTTMLALLALWAGVSLPLVFAGYYFGFRKQPYEHPVRTNQIPRAVPEQPWYTHLLVSVGVAGVLPFGAVFIELFFIFTAIWEKQFYYLFGFLFIVFIILVISVSQISIVMVYFQLCSEDYHWWWRSFIVSGGSALYVFVYSIFYFFTKLEITAFIPTLLYFGYSLLMAATFWILTGTIGFYAAYFFVRRIYGAIKID